MVATIMNESATSVTSSTTASVNKPQQQLKQQKVTFPTNLFSAAQPASSMPVNDTINCKSSLRSANYAILQSRDSNTKSACNTLCIRTLEDDATYSYTIYAINAPQFKRQQPTMIGSHRAYKQAIVRRLDANRREYGVFTASRTMDCIEHDSTVHFVPKYVIQAGKGRSLFSRLQCRRNASPGQTQQRRIYRTNVNGSEKVATVTTTTAVASSRSSASVNTSTITKVAFRDVQEQQFWISVCAACDEMDKDNLIDAM
eukprot:CAMPEP_0198128320 /NCGR_PEP_ID=MMETSP1442-20131203/49037_1 /TAXON_ID= /ORGANISM="Craspedostauros australis, Strain CCMP3328" /LENGTH=256 /DNA_ID=CAMNT_0043788461 /DNA_START=57 /DNA_END=827 /DNA_ORIENTATION=-